MIAGLVEGWLLGLAAGPVCVGTCAPVFVPYMLSEGRAGWKQNGRLLGLFLFGRLLAYLGVGLAVGWAGAALGRRLGPEIGRWGVMLTAAFMIAVAITRGIRLSRPACAVPAVRGRPVAPFIMGLLLGLNVCPPYLTAMARVLQTGGAVAGMVFFAGFFGGTSLSIVPLWMLSPLTGRIRWQWIGTLSAVLVGVWLLLSGSLR